MVRQVIVLEGISGAGKSTQSRLLTEHLGRTRHAVTVGEFSEWSTGRALRANYENSGSRFIRLHDSRRYGDCTHLVLFADLIAKASAFEQSDGEIAVVDGSCDSWLCYTLASLDRTLLTDDAVRTFHAQFRAAFAGTAVRTVHLRLPVEEAAHRLAARDHRIDTAAEKEQLLRISTLFDELYAFEPVIRVDACQEKDAVTQTILRSLSY